VRITRQSGRRVRSGGHAAIIATMPEWRRLWLCRNIGLYRQSSFRAGTYGGHCSVVTMGGRRVARAHRGKHYPTTFMGRPDGGLCIGVAGVVQRLAHWAARGRLRDTIRFVPSVPRRAARRCCHVRPSLWPLHLRSIRVRSLTRAIWWSRSHRQRVATNAGHRTARLSPADPLLFSSPV
jgi:hypothetical protein